MNKIIFSDKCYNSFGSESASKEDFFVTRISLSLNILKVPRYTNHI